MFFNAVIFFFVCIIYCLLNYFYMAEIIVRKTDGTSEPFDRRKLINIIKKAYKSANEPCDTKLAGEIVDSLYIYDGIMCSSIRSQIEERLKERCEGAYAAYKAVKDKKKEIENFVENKKNFIYNYKKASNTANATVDDNSNVGSKNIGVLNAEIHKPDNIQISRSMVMDKLKETEMLLGRVKDCLHKKNATSPLSSDVPTEA